MTILVNENLLIAQAANIASFSNDQDVERHVQFIMSASERFYANCTLPINFGWGDVSLEILKAVGTVAQRHPRWTTTFIRVLERLFVMIRRGVNIDKQELMDIVYDAGLELHEWMFNDLATCRFIEDIEYLDDMFNMYILRNNTKKTKVTKSVRRWMANHQAKIGSHWRRIRSDIWIDGLVQHLEAHGMNPDLRRVLERFESPFFVHPQKTEILEILNRFRSSGERSSPDEQSSSAGYVSCDENFPFCDLYPTHPDTIGLYLEFITAQSEEFYATCKLPTKIYISSPELMRAIGNIACRHPRWLDVYSSCVNDDTKSIAAELGLRVPEHAIRCMRSHNILDGLGLVDRFFGLKSFGRPALDFDKLDECLRENKIDGIMLEKIGEFMFLHRQHPQTVRLHAIFNTPSTR